MSFRNVCFMFTSYSIIIYSPKIPIVLNNCYFTEVSAIAYHLYTSIRSPEPKNNKKCLKLDLCFDKETSLGNRFESFALFTVCSIATCIKQ